jgi:hypothetical protein
MNNGWGVISLFPPELSMSKLPLISGLVLSILLTWSLSVDADFRYGHLVQIHELTFVPDSAQVQGDAFTVLVIQNREEEQVSRVLLAPGEEVVIWYYAAKGRTYTYQCTINGHSMQGTVQAV